MTPAAATTVAAQAIADLCRQFGASVSPLPAGIDGAQLLWAISGNESTFGNNVKPRHEPAYDVGGLYGKSTAMKPLLAKFGSAAACSYGPWQVMLCDAPPGTAPADFNDLTTAARCAVFALNGLLRRWKPQTLEVIGQCYNAGHPTPDPKYTAELAENYAVPMPTESAGGA